MNRQAGLVASAIHRKQGSPVIKSVIFDWDGTLMDSTARICSAVRAAAEALNLTIPDNDDVRKIIGLSLELAFRTLFGPLPQNIMQRLLIEYRYQYVEADTTPTPLFEHTLSTLQELKSRGYRLAVATGKGRDGLLRVLSEAGLTAFFEHSCCGDEVKSKPHPQMLERIVADMKLSKEQCVMVGDTTYDMEMAQRAGMPRVAVSYGAHDSGLLQAFEPIACIDCVSEIKTILY